MVDVAMSWKYIQKCMKHDAESFLYGFFFKIITCTQVYFGMLDALLAAEELPEEYINHCQVPFL